MPLSTLLLPLLLTGGALAAGDHSLATTPIRALNSATELFPTHTRRLGYELNCTDLISDAVKDLVEIDPDTGLPVEEKPSISKGGDAVEFMEGLRNDSGNWYEEVLKNIMIYQCESNQEKLDERKIRCVPEDDAFKGPGGGCIYPSDTSCGVGECESGSNCYWEAPEAGLKRVARYTQEEADGNAKYLGADPTALDQNSYSFTIAKYLILGIVLAVLNMLIWTVFIVARCCCCCLSDTCLCRCCSSKPKEEGYNICYHVRTPIFFYFVFIAGITASAFMTYIGNEDLTKALADTFDHARGGVTDMQAFVTGASTPMKAIEGFVDGAADDCIDILADTDYVETGLDDIGLSFTNFNSNYQSRLPAEAAATMNDALSQVTGDDSPIVEAKTSIREMLDTMESTLVDGRADMKKTMLQAFTQMEDMQAQLTGYHGDINDAEAQTDEYKTIRKMGVLAIFGLALFCVFFGLIGVASYWTPCTWDDILIHLMNLTWFFGSGLVTLTWILAGLTMLVCVLWSDICQFMNIVAEDFEPYAGSQVAQPLNGCMNGTSLVVTFNLSSKVDFQETIDTNLAEIEETDFDTMFQALKDPVLEIAVFVKDVDVSPLAKVLNETTNFASDDSTFWYQKLVAEGGMSEDIFVATKRYCPFADDFSAAFDDFGTYDMTAPYKIEEPWVIMAAAGKTVTAWKTKTELINEPYARQGLETNKQYINRIYDIAGVCTGGAGWYANPSYDAYGGLNCPQVAAPAGAGSPCFRLGPDGYFDVIAGGSTGEQAVETPGSCVGGTASPSSVLPYNWYTEKSDFDAMAADLAGADAWEANGYIGTPEPLIDPINACTSGTGCENYCADFVKALNMLYENDGYQDRIDSDTGSAELPGLVDTLNLKKDMLRDLGTECAGASSTCSPSQEAIDAGTTKTVMHLVDDYQGNLEGTVTDLVATASGALGDIMEQVRILLCNMNCGFVGDLWDEVHGDLCTTMLGGLLQMSISLWLLAIFMFCNAFVGAILVVRMRGIGSDEVEDDDNNVEMKGVTLDLYN